MLGLVDSCALGEVKGCALEEVDGEGEGEVNVGKDSLGVEVFNILWIDAVVFIFATNASAAPIYFICPCHMRIA